MRTVRISANEHQIAVHECGSGSTAIVFIHGNSSSSRYFLPQMESPLAEKYRMVAIDLPGHGDSPPSPEPETTYTFPGYANIVVSAAKELGLEDAVFVGYSMGGHLLLEASPKLQRARGMVIFGAPPVGFPLPIEEAAYPHPVMSRLLLFKKDMTEDDMGIWIEGILSPGSECPTDGMREDMKRTDSRAREALGKSLMEGRYLDEIKIVENMNTPLAIFHGREEQLIRKDYIQGLNIPTLWRGEVQVIPGAGHAANLEQPEAFNSLLQSFIEELPPGPG